MVNIESERESEDSDKLIKSERVSNNYNYISLNSRYKFAGYFSFLRLHTLVSIQSGGAANISQTL